MPSHLVVLGSLNMDFVVRVEHLPAGGETVLGHGFQMIPGGKGANQACAAGRDTGDHMKLSRDKINDLSHKIVAELRKSREFRLKKLPNDVRLEIVKHMTELLSLEDKIDRAARTKIKSQKRDIGEGTEEWDLLLRRYYAEELKKFGIDLNR